MIPQDLLATLRNVRNVINAITDKQKSEEEFK